MICDTDDTIYLNICKTVIYPLETWRIDSYTYWNVKKGICMLSKYDFYGLELSGHCR